MKNEAFQKIVDAITEAYGVCADEIIQFEIKTSTEWLVFFVIATLVTAAVMVGTYIQNKKRDMSWYDTESSIGIFVVGIILLVLFIFGIVAQIYDIYTAKYFPEIMVMQYIKHTINSLSFN